MLLDWEVSCLGGGGGVGQLPTERNDSPGVEERRAVADGGITWSHRQDGRRNCSRNN